MKTDFEPIYLTEEEQEQEEYREDLRVELWLSRLNEESSGGSE